MRRGCDGCVRASGTCVLLWLALEIPSQAAGFLQVRLMCCRLLLLSMHACCRIGAGALVAGLVVLLPASRITKTMLPGSN